MITCIDNLKFWQSCGSECNLKMHVRNLGYPCPYKLVTKTTFFDDMLPNGSLTAYILGSKHHIHNRASASQTTSGFLHRLKTTWTLVHKRLKIGPEFMFMLDKF